MSHHAIAAVVGSLLLTGVLRAQEPVPQTDPFLDSAPSAPRGGALETLTLEPGAESGEKAVEEMETDRDSFTPASSTAARRRLIVESAYTFTDNRRIKDGHSFPELLLRYGLSERVELRFGWNFEIGGAEVGEGDLAAGGRLEREYSVTYGIKIRTTNRDGWIPRTAIILQGFTPVGGSEGVSTVTHFRVGGVAGWKLPNRWRIDAAMRYVAANERDDRFNEWAPSAVVRVPLGDRWAAHAEYFGLLTSGKERNFENHYFSPGLHWLASPDLEIGFRLGWGLNDQSARFFANVGLGWQF